MKFHLIFLSILICVVFSANLAKIHRFTAISFLFLIFFKENYSFYHLSHSSHQSHPSHSPTTRMGIHLHNDGTTLSQLWDSTLTTMGQHSSNYGDLLSCIPYSIFSVEHMQKAEAEWPPLSEKLLCLEHCVTRQYPI